MSGRIFPILICLAVAIVASAPDAAVARDMPGKIQLEANAGADSQGFLEISGRTNLPDGFVLLAVIAPDNNRGIEMERAGLAKVEAGRFLFHTSVDLPLPYKIQIVLSDKENPRTTEFFKKMKPGIVPANAMIRKNPLGGDEIEIVLHARLGAPEQEAALIADHVRLLESMVRTAQREYEAVKRISEKDGSPSQWLRLHKDHLNQFDLDEPTCDPLFPGVHAKAKKALLSLTDCLAFQLAKAERNDKEQKRLADAMDKSARLLDAAQKAVRDLLNLNKDLIDKKRDENLE